MNTVKYVLATGLALLGLGRPTRSLFPLFTDKDVASVPAIIGTWVNGERETFSFQNTADRGYNVTYTDKDGAIGHTGSSRANLASFGFWIHIPAARGMIII